MQLAYAANVVRKGIASQDSAAGEAARSVLGALVESLVNAQFSQLEEKEADDYGLLFLKKKGTAISWGKRHQGLKYFRKREILGG
jgi:putative metalloprotease